MDVGSGCDPGFSDSRAPRLPLHRTPASASSLSRCAFCISPVGPPWWCLRTPSRVPVSSYPIPEIRSLKSASALGFGVLRPCAVAQNVMYVPVCVFIREVIAFILGTRLRFCWHLIFFAVGETQKCPNHILVLLFLLSLKFLRGFASGL